MNVKRNAILAAAAVAALVATGCGSCRPSPGKREYGSLKASHMSKEKLDNYWLYI